MKLLAVGRVAHPRFVKSKRFDPDRVAALGSCDPFRVHRDGDLYGPVVFAALDHRLMASIPTGMKNAQHTTRDANYLRFPVFGFLTTPAAG